MARKKLVKTVEKASEMAGVCYCGNSGPFTLKIQNHELYRNCKCGGVKNMDKPNG